jgi:hypothetical protein
VNASDDRWEFLLLSVRAYKAAVMAAGSPHAPPAQAEALERLLDLVCLAHRDLIRLRWPGAGKEEG